MTPFFSLTGLRTQYKGNTFEALSIRLFGKKNSQQEIRDGLEALYPRIWRYALVLSRDATVANDLAQSAALRALEKADQYQAGTQLDRWVLTMTRRIWLNELRANAVRTAGGLVSVDEVPLIDSAPGVETNIFAREVFNQILDLPEAQRETILLVYVEGFSYREAADALEIPIGTVMSRLSAGRKKLAQQTEEDARKSE